jgi:aldehyde dehydrogenase (NAD+)
VSGAPAGSGAATELAPGPTRAETGRPSLGTPPPGELDRLFARQQAHRWTMARTGPGERIARLKRLKAAVLRHEHDLRAAVHQDFRKAPAEADISEILVFRLEVEHAIGQLRRWMRPRRVATPWILTGTRAAIRYEPRGVVLILAPWNYPIGLVLNPLVAAIAAGNCAIVRPSEKTPYTARVLRTLIGEALPEEEAAVVLGGVDTAQALLDLPFDHIFFTGSSRVGQQVMRRAADHLASVTLELGGKTPAILDRSADVDRAAEAVMWGKFLNAGQTCLAPDYLLLPPALVEPFVAAAGRVLARFLGPHPTLATSPDYCRVVDDPGYRRLTGELDAAVAAGATVALGGERDPATRFLAPTLVAGVTPTMPLMRGELFGPILPLVAVATLDDAIAVVTARPKPLALYLFARDRAAIEHTLASTTAGATVINDVFLHYGNLNLPFGGVGWSGQGSYHGWHGFRAFSHERAVIEDRGLAISRLFHPPYGRRTQRMIELIGRWFG